MFECIWQMVSKWHLTKLPQATFICSQQVENLPITDFYKYTVPAGTQDCEKDPVYDRDQVFRQYTLTYIFDKKILRSFRHFSMTAISQDTVATFPFMGDSESQTTTEDPSASTPPCTAVTWLTIWWGPLYKRWGSLARNQRSTLVSQLWKSLKMKPGAVKCS